MLFPAETVDRDPVARKSLAALSPEQRELYDALNLKRYAQI